MHLRVKLIVLVAFITIIFFIQTVNAQDKSSAFIQDLEMQMFSTTYNSQPMTERLSRLEEIVLGESKKGESDEIRIARLQALLGPEYTKPVIAQPGSTVTAPVENFPDQNNNDITTAPPASDVYDSFPDQDQNFMAPGDEEVEDYPAVSFIETRLFNKTYKGEDISKRLDRLEQNVFNQTKSNLPLSERLDGLKVAVIGNINLPVPKQSDSDDQAYSSNMNPGNFNSNNSSTYYGSPGMGNQPYGFDPRQNDMQQDPNFNNSFNYGSQAQGQSYDDDQVSEDSLKQITTRMEEQVLGQAFPNEPLNIRLDRLEMHVFNKTAPGNTPESRLERLVAVTAAGKTSDAMDLKQINRMRKIQTGVTVGGLIFAILRGFLF